MCIIPKIYRYFYNIIVDSILISKFKHVNNIVTSINIAILTHTDTSLKYQRSCCAESLNAHFVYFYCIHKASTMFFICFFISVMYSKSIILQHEIMTAQVDCTTIHDQESVKYIYISHYAISYWNSKYIHSYIHI